jgi:hypothetical protein
MERELTLIRTEEADVIVSVDDDSENVEDKALDMTEEDCMDGDKILDWHFVNEKEDTTDLKLSECKVTSTRTTQGRSESDEVV